MSRIIHGRKSSSNVQAVMWGLAELGLEVERRDVGGPYGGTDTAAFRAMNPMGRVPVLEEDGLVMFESAAILRHLLAGNPSPDFAATPEGDMWAEWAKVNLCAAFTVPIFWAYYRTPEAERDMAAVLAALTRFEGLLALPMQARQGVWITGERISLADIWVGHLLYRYFTLDLPTRAPDGAQDYYEMLQERQAYRTHVMVDYAELKGRLTF